MIKYKILIGLLLVSLIAFPYAVGPGTFSALKATTSFQIGSTQKITGINAALWGSDSTNPARVPSINAVNIELNRRLGLLYNLLMTEINTVQFIPSNGTIETVDGITFVNPGYKKENFKRVTTVNFTLATTDADVIYDFSGGGGTVTLPSLNADTDLNTYTIKNPTSGSLTFNNAVWRDGSTSTTTLATGRWMKIHFDNIAGKVWVDCEGAL
jgi:hypothetical protein